MSSKVLSLPETIKTYVHDGQTLYIGGFAHCVPYAAVHEMIRQGIRGLTVCKLSPELLIEQMIIAGSVKKLIFGWAGNPGLGNLRVLRRSVEAGVPYRIELEEYTHPGLLARLQAGATGLPFMHYRSNAGTDLAAHNPAIRSVVCPYTGETLSAVPAFRSDVAIFHAQEADLEGNVRMRGLICETKEAAFSADKVIVTVERLVEPGKLKKTPGEVVLPAAIVDAVVVEPWGAHPSFVQGYYDRDNDFYIAWDEATKSSDYVGDYLEEMVCGVSSREEYARRLSGLDQLKAGDGHAL